MVVDTDIARDTRDVCISFFLYTNFTCLWELGSALIPVLWQAEQSEKLMVIARMNEKSLSEIGLESGLCSLCFHQNCRRCT